MWGALGEGMPIEEREAKAKNRRKRKGTQNQVFMEWKGKESEYLKMIIERKWGKGAERTKTLGSGETGKREKTKGHRVKDTFGDHGSCLPCPIPKIWTLSPHPVQGHVRNMTAPFPDDSCEAPIKTWWQLWSLMTLATESEVRVDCESGTSTRSFPEMYVLSKGVCTFQKERGPKVPKE